MCIEEAKDSHFGNLLPLLKVSPHIYDPKLSNRSNLPLGISVESKAPLFSPPKEPRENGCVIKRGAYHRPNRKPGNSDKQET